MNIGIRIIVEAVIILATIISTCTIYTVLHILIESEGLTFLILCDCSRNGKVGNTLRTILGICIKNLSEEEIVILRLTVSYEIFIHERSVSHVSMLIYHSTALINRMRHVVCSYSISIVRDIRVTDKLRAFIVVIE